MAARGVVLVSILVILCLVKASNAAVLFTSLKKTLEVTASPRAKEVLRAGQDNITVTWRLNQTLSSGTDSAYKTIKVKLCYAPISQVDRAWRKTEDHLDKDKTCQFDIVERLYNSDNKSVQTYEGIVEKDVPTATFFVRAYAYNAQGNEVAYGQTTDTQKSTNLFTIQSISGRHVSLDICSVCFSAFSVVALFGFFFNEKRKAKLAQQK